MIDDLDDVGESYISINDNMRLLISPRNWQLQKKVVAKENSKVAGKVSWVSFRYYVSLSSAINDIIHISVAKELFKDVNGLIVATNKVVQDLQEKFSPTYTISVN